MIIMNNFYSSYVQFHLLQAFNSLHTLDGWKLYDIYYSCKCYRFNKYKSQMWPEYDQNFADFLISWLRRHIFLRMHHDIGSIDSAEVPTFGIARSLSMKGCPYDNEVAETTIKIIKTD